VVLTSVAAKSFLADTMGADFRRDLEKDGVAESEIDRLVNRSRRRIVSAPLIVILCADAMEMDVYPDPKRQKAEYLMAVQSVANAGMQMLLAIHAEGLGAVWTCGPLFVPETARNALSLPETWEPQAMFFVGHPDETPKTKELKDIESIVIIK
jgi:F420 biosynthesis protein FbiB-like protein